MFTDYWVIAQLLAQVCTLVLLLYASTFGYKSLRYWVAESDTALQISLERENYLMGAVMQVSVWFQGIALLMFLQTVNMHLPPLVKGAMCATGTLGINAWGYPLLFTKSLAIFVYAIYLFINHLDNQEPNYPLTPHKYTWLFPALMLSIADLYMCLHYFGNIQPDLIATCCSVDFSAENKTIYGLGQASQVLPLMTIAWGSLAGVLFAGLVGKVWEKYSVAGLCIAVGYVGTCIYTLKYHFVKYIYGLPSHLCLFDIFWGKYYAIGYVLFGAYYALLLGMLGYVVLQRFESRLAYPPKVMKKNLRKMVFMGLLLSFILPALYAYCSGYNF